jgi:hypothetical protein
MVTAATEWCETSPRMSLLIDGCLLGHLSYYRIRDLAEGCYSDLHLWYIKELVYRLAVIGINLEWMFTWKSKKLFSTVFFSSLDPVWILMNWEILIEYFDAVRSEILTELKITNLMLDMWVIMHNPLTLFLSLNRFNSLQAQWSVVAIYGGITQYIIDYIYPQGLGALKTVSLFWIFFLYLIVPFVPRDVFCHHFW